MHYGVEVPADTGGPAFKRCIGGHYENMFSCNPIWEPQFETLPDHPITRGVKPFQVKDEWYFNMRFADAFGRRQQARRPTSDGTKFRPILVAKPSDDVRKGPYVHPKGPYPHIVDRQRPRRGDDVGRRAPRRRPRLRLHRRPLPRQLGQRRLPQDRPQRPRSGSPRPRSPPNGVESTVTKEQLDQNLDPKPAKKPKK